MGSLVQLRRRTELSPSPPHGAWTAPIQLDRSRRRATSGHDTGRAPNRAEDLRTLARLLLEAGGVAMWGADDDHA